MGFNIIKNIFLINIPFLASYEYEVYTYYKIVDHATHTPKSAYISSEYI